MNNKDSASRTQQRTTKAAPDETLRLFRELPLPTKMREAANIMKETIRYALTRGPQPATSFIRHAEQLTEWATDWEHELEREESTERNVTELADFIRINDLHLMATEGLARSLLDAGWTKDQRLKEKLDNAD